MIALVLLALLPDPADLVAELRSDDAAVALRAVQQIERLGAEGSPDEVYLAPLAKLLADPDPQTRGLAALALSRHIVACQGKVPEGVVTPLVLRLRDENVHLAAYCNRSLLSLGGRSLPQLRAAFAAGQPRAQRLAALDGCLRLAALMPCREDVEIIFWNLLLDRDPPVRERALVFLHLMRAEYDRPPFRDIPLLVATLRAENPRARALAVRHLAALEEKALPALLDLLEDTDAVVQAEAALLLARLLDRTVIPTGAQTAKLLRALDQPDSASLDTVREALARVSATFANLSEPIVGLDDPRFYVRLTLVVRLLPTPLAAPEPDDPLLRLTSALALVPPPGDLFERLRSDDPAERRAAVQRVERHGAEGGLNPLYVPVLASLLGDADLQTRGLAALALAHHRLAGDMHEPAFVHRALLRGTADREPNVASLCRRALSIPGHSRLDPLDPDGSAPVRDAQLGRNALHWGFLIRLPDLEGRRNGAAALLRAARTLGPQVPDEVLEGLRWGCKSEDAVVRHMCTEGLFETGLRATHTLCELLDDLSPDARRCAMAVVAKLVVQNQPIAARTMTHLRKLVFSPDADIARTARTLVTEVDRVPPPKEPPP
jgi:HEAT repeat protein